MSKSTTTTMPPTTTPTPPPILTLYRGFTSPSYVWSPFVTKLELRLRLAALPHRTAPGSLSASPRHKIPYVQLPGPDGALLSDSTLIIAELIGAGLLPDLNAGLTPAQRAADLGIRALVEDKLQFFSVRERWVDNYATMKDGALADVPWVVRGVVAWWVQRGVVGMLEGQGAGRYTDGEARDVRGEVWEVLGGLVGEARKGGKGGEPFWVLGGEGPTEVDATVFGVVAAGLVCEAAPETAKMIRACPALMDYARRIHDRYFPDYERWED